MTQPVFPKSILGWTDRVDQISNVLANDPNSLAAEVISIENTLGAQTQVEGAPFTGNPVTYSTVSSRITDTLLSNQHPYVSLATPPFSVSNGQGSGTKFGQYGSYNVLYDPFSYYNGTDITVHSNYGSMLCYVEQTTTWAWYNQGWVGTGIQVSQDIVISDIHRWDFPATGIGSYGNNRYVQTKCNWLGIMGNGTRIRVVHENETTQNPYPVINSDLRLYVLRQVPSGQVG